MPDNHERKKPRFVKYPEIVDRVCESIKTGVPISQAAKSAGISPRMLDTWRQRGREMEEGINEHDDIEELISEVQKGYLDVHRRVEEGLHELMTESLVNIQKAGESHWQAAAWILERRFPKYYAHTNRIKFDMSNAQLMLDLIIKEIVPFVPEDRHNELADVIEKMFIKLSVAAGGESSE